MKKSVQKLMAFIFSVSFLQANAQVVYDAQNISILSNWDDSLVPANVPPYGFGTMVSGAGMTVPEMNMPSSVQIMVSIS
jgi:hypothetical protein